MKPPPVHYVQGADGRIAYQVLGEGPVDLIFIPFPGRHNLDVIWENPPLERFLSRLASFARLILLNFRGTGLSDPIPGGAPPLPEEWMTDCRRVMDEVGSARAAFLAIEGAAGIVPALFGATFPDRTEALILINSFATLRRADDYPWGLPLDVAQRFIGALVSNWGTGRNLDFMAPELARDQRFREWFARLERLSASPGLLEWSAETYSAWDVRGILESIKAPALIVSYVDANWIRPGHGRYLAEHIPNARYVERPSRWGGIYWIEDADWTVDEVQAFLTGTRGTPSLDDRVLATVLFTDIVGSTERAAELGDERWRWLLDEHDAVLRREIERFRGRLIKSTGDGFLATFDGPARAIRCALAIREAVHEIGIDVRMGLHTGEIEMRGGDLGGIAVHIAARVMGEARGNEVLVSGAVPPLVAGSGIVFDDREVVTLKGIPGEWRLSEVKALRG